MDYNWNVWIEIKTANHDPVVFANILLTDSAILFNPTVDEIAPHDWHQNLHGKYDAWLIGYFIQTLQRSIYYRNQVVKNILQCSKNKSISPILLNLKLQWPKKCPMDINWNDRLNYMAVERRELSHAMAWLSTFGGAFSALGEKFIQCAEMAGRISLGQMRLALRIGDPSIVARCKLWFSLSLMQRGYLKESKSLILEQWNLLRRQKNQQPLILDNQVMKICQGLWSKLQYLKQLKKNSNKDFEL